MADGADLHAYKKKYDKHDVAIFQNRRPNNVAININKYIAKYDFEIAKLLKPSLEDIEDEDKRAPYEPEESIKRKFAQNAILEILQLCTN